jgi:hypothetical protein
MSLYWLDPRGCLWTPDYSGTSYLRFLEEGDPGYDKDRLYLNYESVKTGRRGRVSRFVFTGVIEIYPADIATPYTTLQICFRDGIICDHDDG